MSYAIAQFFEAVTRSASGDLMAEYKVYKIKNDRIEGPPVVFESVSDDVAAARAEQLVDGVDVELWQGQRFVRGFKGSDK